MKPTKEKENKKAQEELLEEYRKEAEKLNKKRKDVATLTGWICPRCGKGNSPYNLTCPCVMGNPLPYLPNPYTHPPYTPCYPSTYIGNPLAGQIQ